MNVVRHYHKFVGIQSDFTTNFRRTEPFLPRDLPVFVHSHFAVHDLAEETRPILRDEGDEVPAYLTVVVPFETDRTPMVSFRIVSHCYTPFGLLDVEVIPPRSLYR
jgi:hypothetical protein